MARTTISSAFFKDSLLIVTQTQPLVSALLSSLLLLSLAPLSLLLPSLPWLLLSLRNFSTSQILSRQ